MGVYESNIKRDVDEINKLLNGVRPSPQMVRSETNLKFRPYITAIKSKPFLLLAGISGTGKSRIVRELARACWDVDFRGIQSTEAKEL